MSQISHHSLSRLSTQNTFSLNQIQSPYQCEQFPSIEQQKLESIPFELRLNSGQRKTFQLKKHNNINRIKQAPLSLQNSTQASTSQSIKDHSLQENNMSFAFRSMLSQNPKSEIQNMDSVLSSSQYNSKEYNTSGKFSRKQISLSTRSSCQELNYQKAALFDNNYQLNQQQQSRSNLSICQPNQLNIKRQISCSSEGEYELLKIQLLNQKNQSRQISKLNQIQSNRSFESYCPSFIQQNSLKTKTEKCLPDQNQVWMPNCYQNCTIKASDISFPLSQQNNYDSNGQPEKLALNLINYKQNLKQCDEQTIINWSQHFKHKYQAPALKYKLLKTKNNLDSQNQPIATSQKPSQFSADSCDNDQEISQNSKATQNRSKYCEKAFDSKQWRQRELSKTRLKIKSLLDKQTLKYHVQKRQCKAPSVQSNQSIYQDQSSNNQNYAEQNITSFTMIEQNDFQERDNELSLDSQNINIKKKSLQSFLDKFQTLSLNITVK